MPDPEAPSSTFRVDETNNRPVHAPTTAMVVSQFDALAVEAALRIRDAGSEARLFVLSLGSQASRDVIKEALAMGADEGVLLDDPALLDGDSYTTALALSAAIKKIGDVDLVICGRQATDWDFGVTGATLAELLALPILSIAKSVTLINGNVRVERVLGDAVEVVEAPLPVLITVSNELGQPRYPRLPEILAAGRKPVSVWTTSDLDLAPADVGKAGARLKLERLFIPAVQSQCELVEGDSPEEMAARLARRLREARII